MTELAPAPPAVTPPATPAKGRSGKKTMAIIVAIIVAAVVAAGVRIVLSNLNAGPNVADFKVGACINYLPVSSTAQSTAVPNIVDCSGSSARGKIVAVYDGKHFSDARAYCPNNTKGALELTKSGGGSVLVCVTQV